MPIPVPNLEPRCPGTIPPHHRILALRVLLPHGAYPTLLPAPSMISQTSPWGFLPCPDPSSVTTKATFPSR
jgi:hypothetical protein